MKSGGGIMPTKVRCPECGGDYYIYDYVDIDQSKCRECKEEEKNDKS